MRKAFTLIEILVIIGIMAVLASAVAAGFRALQPSWGLRGAVRDLSTDLRYTQQLAVSEQIDHGVKFFPALNKYQLLRYESPVFLISERPLPSGVSFKQVSGFTDEEVVFNPYGAAKESGTIILQNTEGAERTIEVRPSGFVKLVD